MIAGACLYFSIIPIDPVLETVPSLYRQWHFRTENRPPQIGDLSVVKRVMTCRNCRRTFTARRRTARYCSPRCRLQQHRRLKAARARFWDRVVRVSERYGLRPTDAPPQPQPPALPSDRAIRRLMRITLVRSWSIGCRRCDFAKDADSPRDALDLAKAHWQATHSQ